MNLINWALGAVLVILPKPFFILAERSILLFNEQQISEAVQNNKVYLPKMRPTLAFMHPMNTVKNSVVVWQLSF